MCFDDIFIKKYALYFHKPRSVSDVVFILIAFYEDVRLDCQ